MTRSGNAGGQLKKRSFREMVQGELLGSRMPATATRRPTRRFVASEAPGVDIFIPQNAASIRQHSRSVKCQGGSVTLLVRWKIIRRPENVRGKLHERCNFTDHLFL